MMVFVRLGQVGCDEANHVGFMSGLFRHIAFSYI
jgi:hypothetical protein